jgi:3-isopropylmalate/(R)-2-methylmalate dehydratase small subunit
MELVYEGRAWVFGDDIPNDGGLMSLELAQRVGYDRTKLSCHLFDEIRPGFARLVKKQDIIVAGKNFAHGNPHVSGFMAIHELGLGVITESIVRGPLRVAISMGVPILPSAKGISKIVTDGDILRVNFSTGEVTNLTNGKTINYSPLPSELLEIISAGGGMNFTKKRLEAN